MKSIFRKFTSISLVVIMTFICASCGYSTTINDDYYSNGDTVYTNQSTETENLSDIGEEVLQYPFSSGHLQYNIYETYASVVSCNKNASGDIVIPEIVEGVSVKHISEKAFFQCSYIASITIPSQIALVERRAFDGCENLTEVHISDLKNWCNIIFEDEFSNPIVCTDKFYANHKRDLYLNDELVTELVVPDGVTCIGNYAFANCTSIKSVTFPDSVKQIGEYSFYSMPFLTNVNFGSGLEIICERAFAYTSLTGDIYLPEGLFCIGNAAFIPFFGRDGKGLAPYILIDDTLYIVNNRRWSYVGAFLDNEISFEEFKEGYSPFSRDYDYEYRQKWKGVFNEIEKYKILDTGNPSFIIPKSVFSIGDGAFKDPYHLCCYKGSPAVQWVVDNDFDSYEIID